MMMVLSRVLLQGQRIARVSPWATSRPGASALAQARYRVSSPGEASAASAASAPVSALSNATTARLSGGDRVIVVQGSSRGLGLAFVRHLLEETGGGDRGGRTHVVATTRDGGAKIAGGGLQDLLESRHGDRLSVAKLDVERPETIAACADLVRARHGHVDVLFNVSGLLHEGSRMPERRLDQVDQSWLLRSMAVNAAGPLLVAQAFAPLMKRPPLNRSKGVDAASAPSSLICNLSARVGSLGDNGMGGWYAYRMSKAALNMATVNLGIELKRQRTQVVSMHPGTNRTGLSAPFQKNVSPSKLFEAEYGVAKMLEVLHALPQDETGAFFAWDGSRIEW
jgi:NAD(P)-dependent dehydrogenase (short-subunit alcohol dehydrogenase family)